jgi:hypothetical protein
MPVLSLSSSAFYPPLNFGAAALRLCAACDVEIPDLKRDMRRLCGFLGDRVAVTDISRNYVPVPECGGQGGDDMDGFCRIAVSPVRPGEPVADANLSAIAIQANDADHAVTLGARQGDQEMRKLSMIRLIEKVLDRLSLQAAVRSGMGS